MKRNLNDTSDYQYRRREDTGAGPWEICMRCDYPAPVAPFRDPAPDPYGIPQLEEGEILACALCANIAATSPGCPDSETARAICHAANAILHALGAFAEDEPKPRL